MEELWKSIINYPEYEISNLGNCRNISTVIRSPNQKPYKNLKFTMGTTGYKKYDLYKYDENGVKTRKTIPIHRLIAIHFISNPENKREVDHIDNDRLNNSIDNLRWVSPSENMRNRSTSGNLNSTSNYIGIGYDKSRNKWRYQIKVDEKTFSKRFDTEHEAAVKRDEFILDNDLEYFKLNFIHI
jgi:hypothetical protein